MDFVSPLIRSRLVRRYKRFLAEVVIDGETDETTVHVPNPGAMLGLATQGVTAWLTRSPSATRKLPYTLELVEAEGAMVDVNTHRPNRLVAEAIAAGRIPELVGYSGLRAEAAYGEASRVDLLLTEPDRRACWVEIKGVTLSRTPGLAEWPDCVSTRAAKHLRELQAMAEAGDRAVVAFVVQRSDCEAVSVARDLDPRFAAAFDQATAVGVEVLAYSCEIDPRGTCLARRLEFHR